MLLLWFKCKYNSILLKIFFVMLLLINYYSRNVAKHKYTWSKPQWKSSDYACNWVNKPKCYSCILCMNGLLYCVLVYSVCLISVATFFSKYVSNWMNFTHLWFHILDLYIYFFKTALTLYDLAWKLTKDNNDLLW